MKWISKFISTALLIMCSSAFSACSEGNKQSKEIANADQSIPLSQSGSSVQPDISILPEQSDGSNPSEQLNQPEEVTVLTIERHPYAADYRKYFGKLYKLPEKSDFGYDIRSTDLEDCDLTKEYDKLLLVTYDSKTTWPDILPESFDPGDIMEQYKNPGLNIRSLHEEGITGKGVGIAIIDQPLLVDHAEYKAQLKYYSERDTVKTQEAAMHGAGVASIAVGKSVGVAPEADLYYIADDFFRIKDDYSLLAESINKLLDINKFLPRYVLNEYITLLKRYIINIYNYNYNLCDIFI